MSDVSGEAADSEAQIREEGELIAKLGIILREELGAMQPRFILIRCITSLIPRYTGIRVRAWILKALGIRIGHGSIVMGTPFMYGAGDIRHHLQIGDHAVINVGCTFDLNAEISIGDHVAIGHEVMILTSSHRIGQTAHRAGTLFTAPVRIEDGAWIGARSVLMPGVTVGAGSVIGAGAIVTRDVPPNMIAGGVPARIIRSITAT